VTHAAQSVIQAAEDYTPFGYLRNPGHRADSWQAVWGGNLRTADDSLGLEWVYPWHKDRAAGAGISLTTSVGGRACRRRADFQALGYTSRHHSADVLGFQWSTDEVWATAHFFLTNDDALAVHVSLTNQAGLPRPAHLGIFGRAWARERAVDLDTQRPVIRFRSSGVQHALAIAGLDASLARLDVEGEVWAGWETTLSLGPGQQVEVTAVLGRADDPEAAGQSAVAGLNEAKAGLEQRLRADAAFRAGCPELSGDWPPDWPNGLVYDMETTRALVLTPGGIFRDVWPTWMAAWPRVVLAEGTLDMLRLAFADPPTAQRAVLSLFRDAPMPNVPCVFQDGGYNMLAADGRRCGTSPAWCLPFLNLQLLYLRTLDREWLAALYPYLAAYLEWWLEHRTDAEGFVMYACTWESGEDGNPRLDPTGSGDGVISDRIRPVELQATLAHAASVLAFFAAELGRGEDRRRWRRVQSAYWRRTQRLFDSTAGRFRDWLVQEGKFVPPCPEKPYWGVDACRWSPLSLTPLLVGSLAPEHVRALSAELTGLACAPWTSWPSWCYVLVECAAAAGLYEWAGEIAWKTIDRVYRVTNRRGLAELSRPTPGAAPEFWPQDWRTFQGCDAYGWGATTANLLVRHLIGFKDSPTTRGWEAILTPALPASMRQAGRRYTLRKLQYRGLLVDLTYVVDDAGLSLELELPRPMRCHVRQASGTVYASRAARSRHRIAGLGVGKAYRLSLR
jgi:hypothetical protein